MSDKEIWRIRYKNRNKYFPVRPINAIIINPSYSLAHELSKFMSGWITAKGGDMRILFHQIVPHILDFCEKVEFMKKWYFKPRKFITEVKDVNEMDDQYDLVVLDSDERLEFDKAHKSKDKKNVTIYDVKKKVRK